MFLIMVADRPSCAPCLARREVNYRDGSDDGDGTGLVEPHVPRHADADAADDVVTAPPTGKRGEFLLPRICDVRFMHGSTDNFVIDRNRFAIRHTRRDIRHPVSAQKMLPVMDGFGVPWWSANGDAIQRGAP
ncbi:hypothetical protein [Nocardia sp. CY41]|uniref:hypothetical protein n=1 Tax=Nocardia sp. CY41 TaxID=2608686 RepID=UPI00135BBA1A|nr:hypothetical protein [Nocardia sp. CY41]